MATNREFSFHTLQKNYNDLLKVEEKYFKCRKRITYRDFGNWDKYILELTRLLHNYLAAYSSFVDCMRAARKTLESPEFRKEFIQQLEHRHIEERTRFIKDLRNFSQHKQLPIVSFRLSIVYLKGNESLQPDHLIKDSPSLRVNDLLKWNKWSSFSRKFLLQQSIDELDIIPLISECQKAEEEMYQWILQKTNVRRE